MIQDRDSLTVLLTRRNPVLADVFNRLGYMERKVVGLERLLVDMNFKYIGRGFSGHWKITDNEYCITKMAVTLKMMFTIMDKDTKIVAMIRTKTLWDRVKGITKKAGSHILCYIVYANFLLSGIPVM